MKIAFSSKKALPKNGARVLAIKEGGVLSPTAKEVLASSAALIEKALASSRFTGKAHQTLTVFTSEHRVVLYGTGDGAGIDPLWCENAGGSIFAALADSGETEAALLLDADDIGFGDAEFAARLAYGVLLRSYRFDKYRTTLKDEEKPTLSSVTVLADSPTKARRSFADLQAVADGVNLTRDLVSEPPNVLYPVSYAQRLQALEADGLAVRVLGEEEMTSLGMGALLGVGQGSRRESRLVIMEWNGGEAGDAPLAFVGKGVCFDTGGISIKGGAGMEDMKWDMAGSGVVAGLMKALAGRKARVNAVGVVGLVENMPDGNAQRPSDVVTSMSGQTIEIINTDAEGRLVLADALWYTKETFKPRFMIDLATLTGAMLVSLGQINCGYFANNDALADEMAAAGKAVGEGVWRLPLGEEYNKMMNSDIADMKNAGPRYAGSITAACFLERFVGQCPWIHMDIAGVAWSSKDTATVPKGGTGWGVRLLDHLVRTHYES